MKEQRLSLWIAVNRAEKQSGGVLLLSLGRHLENTGGKTLHIMLGVDKPGWGWQVALPGLSGLL